NQVRQIYVPTNGYYTDKTVKQVSAVLENQDLELFVVELSLDGMPEYHDRFRVARGAFARAMQTYDALVEIQARDPRLRIYAISTATNANLDEIKQLTTLLFERCPKMDHHNLALIRGDRKNPALLAPNIQEYEELYQYIRRLWLPREEGRYGGIVEPLMQWAKGRTERERTQVIPCRAGQLSAVVYANGDVSVCELHKPIGNLRQNTFWEIWGSEEAKQLRASIARKECYCTTEVFLWPSIVYQPARLAQALIHAQVWQPVKPLQAEEKMEIAAARVPSAPPSERI